MNQYQSSSQLKNRAKEMLSGKYSAAILLTAFANLLTFTLSLFMETFITFFSTIFYMITSSSATGVGYGIFASVIAFGVSVLTGVLNLGICLFFLNIACGNPYSASDLLYGFRNHFKTAIFLSFILNFIYTLCSLPTEIFSYLTHNNLEVFLTEGILNPLVYVLMLLAMIGMIIYLPIGLAFSQCFYLMLDFPQYSAKELLLLSIRVMKGHKKRLFYIQISFLPLTLLSLLTFGIGTLWLTPYMNMTYTLFFLDIMNPKNKS